MSPFQLFMRSFIVRFTKYGRYGDLILGLVVVALGAYWSNPWLIGFGALSLVAFAFDLNGFIQRRTMSWALARRQAKGR